MRSKGKSKRRFMKQRGGLTYDELTCSNYKNLYNATNLTNVEAGMIIAAANLCGDTGYAIMVEKAYPNRITYNTASR